MKFGPDPRGGALDPASDGSETRPHCMGAHRMGYYDSHLWKYSLPQHLKTNDVSANFNERNM